MYSLTKAREWRGLDDLAVCRCGLIVAAPVLFCLCSWAVQTGRAEGGAETPPKRLFYLTFDGQNPLAADEAAGNPQPEMSEDVEVEARAQWENNRLILTRQVSGGGVVTETFMPSVDGKRLTVAVEFAPGGPGGVEFQRVYERPRA